MPVSYTHLDVYKRQTQVPAVLVEAGFIDNPDDNRFFDENFDAIAQAIADGVLETIRQQEAKRPEYYQVQSVAKNIFLSYFTSIVISPVFTLAAPLSGVVDTNTCLLYTSRCV